VPQPSARLVSRSRGRVVILTVALAVASPLAPSVVAQSSVPVPMVERARGAAQIVVGRVSAVNPVWQVNEFGDRLIVSVLRVTVDETLKGAVESAVDVEVEGGTIGELTLHVSDQESFARGDRAVFYLRRSARGALVPHLRGLGALKLDRNSRVPNSSLTLDEIRRTVAAARQQ
jgi:hypothetical protein